MYLIVNRKGSTRTTKQSPNLSWDEISIALSLQVPDSLFKKPMLQAAINVKEEEVRPEVISPEVINNIQDAIKEHSGLEVKLTIQNPEE